MALWIALPVARSQTIVVSRWLVMPMAAMSEAVSRAFLRAVFIDHRQVAQISSGTCSTQPDAGKCWVNSILPMPTICCRSLKTMARLEVVPWSMARI